MLVTSVRIPHNSVVPQMRITRMAESLRRFPRAIDAHCHLHDPRLHEHIHGVIQRAVQWNLTHVSSCACYEEDWTRLEQLLSGGLTSDSTIGKTLQIVPSFGIHPWWADAKSPEYLSSLRAKLTKYPKALLGEIGLCKSARGKKVDSSVQEQVFQEQLRLAAEMQRPCVIHCVGAYGKLLEILQREKKQRALPPVLILHSYSGAAEMIPAFLTLENKTQHGCARVYFSLNAKQLTQDSHAVSKGAAICRKVPVNALLLETDSPDQPPTIESMSQVLCESTSIPDTLVVHKLNEPALVQLALVQAAAIRQVPLEELAGVVCQNALSAFRIDSD